MTKMKRFSIVFFVFCTLIVLPISGFASHSSEFVDLLEQPISTDVFNDFSFEIMNSTGQDWTGFYLTLLPAWFTGDAPSFGDNPYTGEGTHMLGVNDIGEPTMEILGLNIPDGGTYSFSLNIEYDEGNDGWQVLGYPVVSSQVPEPSIVFMICSGLTGLAWVKRRALLPRGRTTAG